MLPSASTISSAVTWAAMPPRSRPVPWVPVWIAPATVCSWMSPMFARASPRACRCSLRSLSWQPASTVTSPAAASTARTARSPPGRSITPVVTATGVKEWPDPVIRTVRPSSVARVTASATSPADRGTITRCGVAAWLPAQFCQRGAARTMPGPYPNGACSGRARSPRAAAAEARGRAAVSLAP